MTASPEGYSTPQMGDDPLLDPIRALSRGFGEPSTPR
jgi:hypothetical protein